MTLIRLGRLYIKNFISNFNLMINSKTISDLDFSSYPVLVLGAGPSLDNLLNFFHKTWNGKIPGIKERNFKIICADTCLPALYERGIQPDLTVILECQHWNLRAFVGGRGQKTDAAVDLSALPGSLNVLDGKNFVFFTPWISLRIFERLKKAGFLPDMIPPLGSVGLSAVSLALKSGTGTIITGGLDFSFSLDAFHARSTPGHRELERKHSRFKSMINSQAVLREGSFSTKSKTGNDVRSDPALRNYQKIFHEEFGGNERILDIISSGLPLGVKTISMAEAFNILSTDMNMETSPLKQESEKNISHNEEMKERAESFIGNELEILNAIKKILTGEAVLQPEKLEELLDTADYLWAHFPDCAGAGGRRPGGTDLGFLKRVRMEIDPFISLWERVLSDLTHPWF